MTGYHIHVANWWAVFYCGDEGEANVYYSQIWLICRRIMRHKRGILLHYHTRFASAISSEFVFSYTLCLVSPTGCFFISIIISCFIGFVQGPQLRLNKKWREGAMEENPI